MAEDVDHGHGYVTKDSGAREEFDSGARRDTQDGKPRYDLIPPGPLKRLAELYERGLQKYGENNWTKGMPTSRYLASAFRHLEAYRSDEDPEEDHLAAVLWNVMAIMHFEGSGWDDKYDWSPQEPPIIHSLKAQLLEELEPGTEFSIVPDFSRTRVYQGPEAT